MYTVTGCPFCKRAKALMQEQHVAFEERNVAEVESYADELIQMTGHAAVPVTLIAGETIVGFDKTRLVAAIKRLAK